MGSSTEVKAPDTPKPPTATETAQEYAKALPVYYQTALEYEPQMAILQRQINEQLYPQTSQLQENLAGQALTGSTQAVPDWYKSQIDDQLRSTFGSNLAYNPLAQESYGIATMQANRDYQDYYRNLGLTVGGRQPLAQSANIMQSYTPAANMQNSATNYGNYSNAYSSMYGANAQLQGQTNAANAQMISSGIGAIGSMGGAAMKMI